MAGGPTQYSDGGKGGAMGRGIDDMDTTTAAVHALTTSSVLDDGHDPLSADDALHVVRALGDAGLLLVREHQTCCGGHGYIA